METREKEDKKNKRVGWITSVGLQLLLLLLFYFLIAWKPPFPPIPEYGIELGYISSSGAASSPPPSSTPVQEEQTQEPVTQPEPETVENTEATEEASDEPVTEVEEQTTDPVEQPVEEATEPEVQEKANEVETPAETTEEASTAQTEEPTPTEITPAESSETSDTQGKGEAEEEKEIDERAIYGSQGTSTGDGEEGASLALSGWIWDFQPDPDDTSDESGRIVYRIEVDQDGYLVKITTVTSTVSPAVERKYREAVQKLTFSKTSDYKPAQLSSGTITFVIKSR